MAHQGASMAHQGASMAHQGPSMAHQNYRFLEKKKKQLHTQTTSKRSAL